MFCWQGILAKSNRGAICEEWKSSHIHDNCDFCLRPSQTEAHTHTQKYVSYLSISYFFFLSDSPRPSWMSDDSYCWWWRLYHLFLSSAFAYVLRLSAFVISSGETPHHPSTVLCITFAMSGLKRGLYRWWPCCYSARASRQNILRRPFIPRQWPYRTSGSSSLPGRASSRCMRNATLITVHYILFISLAG